MQSQPAGLEFTVKAPLEMDGRSCQGRVVRNELLPIGKTLVSFWEMAAEGHQSPGRAALLALGWGVGSANGMWVLVVEPSLSTRGQLWCCSVGVQQALGWLWKAEGTMPASGLATCLRMQI